MNPLKSRWTKSRLNRNNENNGNNNNNDNNDQTTTEQPMKLRRLKVLGAKRFTLPPRQQPRVKMNRFKTTKLPPTQAEEMEKYYSKKAEEEALEASTNSNEEDLNDSATPSIDEKTKEKILENLSSTPTPTYDGEQDNLKIDPSKVVKEVQTITSEVTQHVEGNHLQVKTLTLTTTIERTLHPTESDFGAHLIQPTLDLSVNNIEATSIPETPALVISRTYSVTERTMRTTVVPVFDGTATQSHTVTESFFIRKLITAYRTLPPGDMILIDSTSTLDQAGATALLNGSHIVDDLLMAEQQTVQPTSVDSNILPTEMPSLLDNPLQGVSGQIEPSLMSTANQPFGMMPQMAQPSSPMLANQFDLNNPLLLAAALQNPQLAALYFGLQQMKHVATTYSTIVKPTKVMQTETLFSTKMVSFYDGRQTRSRTILEPTSTTEKMVQTFTTEVLPMLNPQYAMQQAQLQNMFANQFGMLPGPAGTITNPVVAAVQSVQPQFQITPTLKTSTILKTVTTVTESTTTKSKVYTLVYNAFSTRYRTITSTSVTPTTVTTVLTETIQVSPTTMPNFFG